MNAMRRYRDAQGRERLTGWLKGLKDTRARARIYARIDRLEGGNIGDCEPVGEGVYELRIHYGPGYRVYFCYAGQQIILLLCGGDKGTQKEDIKQAIAYKQDFEKREKTK